MPSVDHDAPRDGVVAGVVRGDTSALLSSREFLPPGDTESMGGDWTNAWFQPSERGGFKR